MTERTNRGPYGEVPRGPRYKLLGASLAEDGEVARLERRMNEVAEEGFELDRLNVDESGYAFVVMTCRR